MRFFIILLLFYTNTYSQSLKGKWVSKDSLFFLNIDENKADGKLRVLEFCCIYKVRFVAMPKWKKNKLFFSIIENKNIHNETKSSYKIVNDSKEEYSPTETTLLFDINILRDINISLISTNQKYNFIIDQNDSSKLILPNDSIKNFEWIQISSIFFDPLIIPIAKIKKKHVAIKLYDSKFYFMEKGNIIYKYMMKDNMLILYNRKPKFRSNRKHTVLLDKLLGDFKVNTFHHRGYGPVNKICDTLYKIN